jgi:PAS domain S-box-containing protein
MTPDLLRTRRRALVPVLLVLVALTALAVLPLLIMRRTDALREQITTFASPASVLTTHVQSALALESAATRGFVLTGDTKWADDYRNARDDLRRSLLDLEPLCLELGPTALAQFRALVRQLDLASPLLDSLFDGRITRGTYMGRLDEQQRRLEDALAAAVALDRAVNSAVIALHRNESLERIGALVTIAIVIAALVAAAIVANLAGRYRAIAMSLDESERRFRQIADAIHDFIWLSDLGFREHFYANLAYERIWGRSRDALYANTSTLLDGVHPEDRDRVMRALEQLPHGGAYDIEFRVVRPDGQIRWVWSRGFPVRNERGVIYRVAGITEDITERHLASESRMRLIRGFTHDVKNPLGAADGFLALLEDGVVGTLDARQQESVARARRSLRAALEVIAHLLDIARAEAGQLETVRDRVDVAGIARDVTEDFLARARARNLQLTFRPGAPAERELVARTDAGRVRQILANLLSNAVKYTEPGGRIEVQAAKGSDGAPAPGDWVSVAVSDTGSGIPPEKQAMLFREFTRFDPDAAEGSGIGLAISQRVAHALNGAITVRSEVGVGSTFTLWLPVDDHQARAP